MSGPAIPKRVGAAFRAGFADIRFTVDDLINCGDKVVTR
jgi:hypothetical protein